MTDVATELMGADAVTAQATYQAVLRDLVNSFELDIAFLRHTDIDARSSVLIAEWPPRSDVAEPDPLQVVRFDDAEPVFASTEEQFDVRVIRAGDGIDDYRKLVESASGFVADTLVAVPMVDNGITVGVLGFGTLSAREWFDDELNALRAIAALMTQVHTRVEAENRFRYAASHDELTGLFNRRALLGYLRERLDDRSTGPVAILALDLDRLKALNDFLGHLAGDEYILAIADILRAEIGSDAVVARLGGDEFVVVLRGPANSHMATLAAKAILDATGSVSTPGMDSVRRASIGISVAHPGRISAEDALRGADQAALIAKGDSDNNIAQFTEAVQRQSELRSDVEIHLRSAIENDALVLYFQPELDLMTGAITAVEALVRWQHPIRGLLPPTAFIPVAEATNLAPQLGRWVLEHACRTLAEWQEAVPGLDISMRVNVSPAQLVSTDFVRTVAAMLRRYRIDAASLCLEITEVAVVKDLDRTRRTLLGLRRHGVHVAIDDFGTGYSSLSHLKELPVDALKIDRTFVTNLGTADRDDLAIIASIVGLAASFGLDVIAEGVETRDAIDVLLGLGCRRAQGYLISRPVPAPDALELLRGGTIDL
ncbi:putative bifunctional diguanylate cyclase/phosphodiesterase [Rhodococcoides kyotonense]|uniref:Diguanylate cyclase (GGDEF) domain-containing protein n=1 Tax=Rhodococcoides kyotonense TaxID=398843 RepID=A0A239J8M6_9NOCA|nr:EAL domain-containing protein [Rhodococcus kyotonensis]SNT02002.1 diguanylate cyclase (GGDEF) domain-containing protein [Rhodococcus kyotonensis]